MYREFFGLKENPFSIAPDPHYFYLSEGHREALAHLIYGVNSEGGFILLTGEVGTGKTTVCRCLLEQLPGNADIAFILNPKLTVEELLATICDEFGIAYPENTTSNKVLVSRINEYLLDAHTKGRRAILIVEEAQNLSVELLEQIRLLTNLETSERKLLQIIMLGQPELREILARPELRQLSQRITARYHLGPLSKEEVPEYVNHRLTVAGLVRGRIFPAPTLRRLYRLTGGVPRLINVICDRALTGAYVEGKEEVDRKILVTAAREVSGAGLREAGRRRVYQAVAAVAVLLLCGAFIAAYYSGRLNVAGSVAQAPELRASDGGKVKDAMPTVPVVGEKAAAVLPRGTKDTAYLGLFDLWQIAYDGKDRRGAREQAEEQGLQWLEEKGDINDLRQMNRPAVVKLADPGNGEYYGVLTSLKGEMATISVGGATRSVTVKDLTAVWSGDYVLLWRAPAGYKGKLKQGSRGPVVAWLDRQLAKVQGRQPGTGRQSVYDEEMAKHVMAFQSASGLEPDGVTGVRTLVCLTGRAGSGGPTLEDHKGGY